MLDFISSQTREIFSKCIHRYAKKEKADEQTTALMLFLKGEGESREVGYKICLNHVPALEVGIMDVLGVKIDFKGYSLFVPPQIKKILEGFEVELGSNDVEVCVYLDRNEDDEVVYFLYSKKVLIKKFALDSVIKI